MLTYPTKNLFIEGSDCSGKTTLIKQIHKDSNYLWHIMDRSQVSRSIFSNMYKRDLYNVANDLHLELSDLNNRWIFLNPDLSIVHERLKSRGDEIHDENSITAVWKMFNEASEKLKNYPNITIYSHSSDAQEIISQKIVSSLMLRERALLREVATDVRDFVLNTDSLESYPLGFSLYDDGEFEEASAESMNYESEREYYEKIYNGLHDKIKNEFNGDNVYDRKENSCSRRFVYTDDSCISFIQCSVRSGLMDFHVVIRSSNVEDTFYHDLKFLYYLASTCYSQYFSSYCSSVRIRFNLNSAHILM